jgi:hypothetical protein
MLLMRVFRNAGTDSGGHLPGELFWLLRLRIKCTGKHSSTLVYKSKTYLIGVPGGI